jgi:ABC-type dipeptide/oligopeptide/nickel transport system ATPase component
MADGAVVETGTPDEIFTRPKSERTIKFLQSVLQRNREMSDASIKAST